MSETETLTGTPEDLYAEGIRKGKEDGKDLPIPEIVERWARLDATASAMESQHGELDRAINAARGRMFGLEDHVLDRMREAGLTVARVGSRIVVDTHGPDDDNAKFFLAIDPANVPELP